MLAFSIRAFITIIGVFLGNLLVSTLQSHDFFQHIFSNLENDSILLNSIHFGIVFCVAGIFFLSSSVVFNQLNEFERRQEQKGSTTKTLAQIISLILGLTVSLLFMPVLKYISPEGKFFSKSIFITVYLLVCFIVTKFSVTPISHILKASFSNLDLVYKIDEKNEGKATDESVNFLVDTNILIDGRILQLAKNNLFNSTLLIPDFVINELQHIADSEKEMLRKKGKRGLEILDKLRHLDQLKLNILQTNKQGKVNVDSLLIKLAKQTDARLISNDINLCKIAKINEIRTVNLNLIALAIKPELMRGDKVKVTPVKKGKSRMQAVAYTEDGTMMVIENAAHLIGQELEVEISESIQSQQGKMLFSKIVERDQ